MEEISQEAQKFSFEINEEGNARRLTVESDIQIDVEDLRSIQDIVQEEFPEMTSTEPDNLHFTWAHYGKPDQLFEELLGQNPNLDRKQFDDALQTLLSRTSSSLAEEVEARIGEIGLLGRGAVVLQVDLQDLLRVRTEIYDAVLNFLEVLGIGDPHNYIQQTTYHSNLHNTPPERSKPHITIGRINENTEENLARLQSLSMPTDSVRLKVTPSHIRNATAL